MSDWRYILQRISGPDAGKILHPDLPLVDVSLTRVLSGPGGLRARLPLADAVGVVDENGETLLDEWGTAIWAEASGQIRGGGILVSAPLEDHSFSIDCMGYSGYLRDMPFDDVYYGIGVDPLAMVRLIWNHVQSQPNGDLGVVVDVTASPVRIGTEIELVEFTTGLGETVSFEAGPFKLAWWVTDDLQREVDTLASETPFEYLEHDQWDAGQGSIVHRLELGYPTIGHRQEDLRFVLGENVLRTPRISTPGENFANGVIVLGNGEGRDRRRSPLLSNPDGRLRRVAIVEDASLTSVRSTTARAREELASHGYYHTIDNLEIIDHPNAPVGTFDVGDEIPVDVQSGPRLVSMWARIVSMTLRPDVTEAISVELVRTDRSTP